MSSPTTAPDLELYVCMWSSSSSVVAAEVLHLSAWMIDNRSWRIRTVHHLTNPSTESALQPASDTVRLKDKTMWAEREKCAAVLVVLKSTSHVVKSKIRCLHPHSNQPTKMSIWISHLLQNHSAISSSNLTSLALGGATETSSSPHGRSWIGGLWLCEREHDNYSTVRI